MLDRFPRLRRDEFDHDDTRYAELTGAVAHWRAHALEIARRLGRRHQRDLGLGRDM
ncbi:MAG TPA: hypothetical protein VN615_02705 [Gaiellales bacterium]|nr:hypothetical protein [Gaiellales bacterium]